MRERVLRMAACGIPMQTAVKVYADFKRRAFPGMEKTMLPAIRRHLGKERFPASKVEEIYKSWSSSEGKYCYYASIGNCRAVKFS